MICNLNIEDIEQPDSCEVNISGVVRLLFIPRKHVARINALPASVPMDYADVVTLGSPAMTQHAVDVKNLCVFASIFCAEDLGELRFSPVGSDKTRLVKTELDVFHPGFKKKILGFMGGFVNCEFVLLVQLVNGDWYLVGNERRGAKFSDETMATSGKAVTDPNGAYLHFEFLDRLPRMMFRGWEPEHKVYGVELFHYVLATEDGDTVVTEDDFDIELESEF